MIKFNLRKAFVPAALVVGFGGGVVASSASADQPYMHSALDNLGSARNYLVHAAQDKGGHRLKAISYVDRAMNETRLGISFERDNNY